LKDNGAWQDIIRRNAYMKTPTPKKIAGKSTVKRGRSKGSSCITTPEKAQISRHYQSLGGDSVRDAAAATARHFKSFRRQNPSGVRNAQGCSCGSA